MIRFPYSIIVVLLVAVSCRQDGLHDELRSLDAQLYQNGYTDTALARRVSELRPHVIEANDPVIDSLYNGIVREIADTGRYLRNDLWLYSAVTRGEMGPLGSLDLGIAHDLRYWGNYSAARSAYGRISISTSMSNPNAVANLGMEYERIGLLNLALQYITLADSVFSLQSDARGRIWMQRLLYSVYSKTGQRAEARRCLSTYRMLHDQIFRVAKRQMADTVTNINLIHSILQGRAWREDLELAFGDSAMQYLNLYKHVTTSTQGRWRNTLASHLGIVGPLPKPIFRMLPVEVRQMLTADSIVQSHDGHVAYATRFGTYALRGNRWLLTKHEGEQHANILVTSEPQRIDTLFHTSAAIENVTPLSNDTLVVFTRDEVSLIDGTGRAIQSQPLTHRRFGRVLEAASVGRRGILVVCTFGILLYDRQSLRLQSSLAIGDVRGALPISFGSAGASIVNLADSIVLIKRHGSPGHIACEISGTTPILRPLIVTEDVNCSGERSILFHEGQSITGLTWNKRGRDSLCLSAPVTVTEPTIGSRGEDRPVTRVRSAQPLLAIQQYDNIDVVDTRAHLVYPQFALPIPIEVTSADIVGVYRDASGKLSGYYASGKDIVRFDLSQRAFPFRPTLYLMEHDRTPNGSLTSHRLSDASTMAAGNMYTITTTSNLVTSSFPLLHRIVGRQRGSWHLSDTHRFWCVTLTPTFDDEAVNVSAPLLKQPLRVRITYPLVSRPWFLPTLVGIVAISLGLIASSLMRSRRRRQQAAIETAKAQQLEALREDMHDMIGSRLVRIASLTRQASPENTEDVLSRIHDMTLVTVRSLRNLLTLMSEGSMTDADFYGSIREYVMESCRDAGLSASVDIDIDSQDRVTLDNAGRHELLMIVSEMMTNTVRHAQATKVRLRVAVANDATTLQWSDDGIGLDPEAQRGNGLNNIQRRATRIKATVNLETAKDIGTRYTLMFPARKDS